MIRVECPSCAAPYEVDERRLPPAGLKMRCPKCGASFPVGGPEAGATPAPSASPPAEARAPKKTVQGVGPGVAPPAPPKIAPPKPPAPPPPRVAPPAPPKPAAPPAGDLDLDLPAPVSKKGAGAPADFELDLPAPSPSAPKKKPLAPAFVEPVAPKAVDLDLDLPAPASRKGAGAPADFELDLPAPSPAAPKKKPLAPAFVEPAAPKAVDRDLDLPKPAPKKGAAADLDLDLPAPSPRKGAGDLDLDLPMPASSKRGHEVDLPAPRASGPTPFDAWGEVDLPGPAADLPRPSTGQVDLPQPAFGSLDLPQASRSVDLPALSKGAVDLPKISGGLVDVPMPARDRDLPKISGGLVDVPMPARDRDLPKPSAGGRASADFSDLVVPSVPPGASGDDLSLPEPRRRGVDLDGDIDLRSEGRKGAGGTGFGELDLGVGGGEGDEDLEFDALPEEARASTAGGVAGIGVSSAPPQVAAIPRRERPATAAPPKRRWRSVAIFGGVLVALAGIGAALQVTPYGPFAIYELERFLPAAGNDASVRAVLERAEPAILRDTYDECRGAIRELAAARRETGLHRGLLARSLLLESWLVIRYGADAAASGRASAIDERLSKRHYAVPRVAVARASDALRRGDLGVADQQLTAARAEAPDDPFVSLLGGELAIARADLAAAKTAFEQALGHGGGAAAEYGLARVAKLAGESPAVTAAAERALAASPRHAEARVLLAEIALEERRTDDALRGASEAAGLAPVEGQPLGASNATRARALSIVGRVHESQGGRNAALRAYEQALVLEPFSVDALLGAGRVLLSETRARDALTRFESAMQAIREEPARGTVAPTAPLPLWAEARIGAAQAMLKLDRAPEAGALLQQIAQVVGEHERVLYYTAKVAEAADLTDDAVAGYRRVIALVPTRFDGYLALAQLYFAKERPSDAAAVLEEAAAHVEVTAEVRRLRGESELRRGELARAEEELRGALALDPHDRAAQFMLGVTLRRAGRLADAETAFAAVAAVDPSYPGVALERGLIFEALGRSEQAVQSYHDALAQRPDDPDLLLRLAGAQIAAGQIDEAERTLQKVAEERPSSAELEHYLGRVELARRRLPEALTHFEQSVEQDPERALYRLYVGWTNLEMNNLAVALREANEALERDPTLGRAHWLRGQIRVRTGAVQDALVDLQRALQLDASIVEAWAGIAESYDQLARRREAIDAYQRALDARPSHGEWWYRYGRLLMDDGRPRDAGLALARATVLGDAETARPGWLPDAHRLQAEAHRRTGDRQGAIVHFRRYLELAPPSAIDRADVERQLLDLGAAPN